MLADIHRKRAGARDADEALRLYREVAERDPTNAEAQRGIGLMLFKQGKLDEAAPALLRYLSLKPKADDRGFIEFYLQKCVPKS